MSRQDRRQQIMQAAERLFRDRRFHEVTLDEVAQTAKVGKGTIYRYFKDKDDLFFQTATSGFDDLCKLLRRKVPGDAPFQERLLGACAEIGEFFARRRQLSRMMQAEEGRVVWRRGKLREHWMGQRRKLISAVAAILTQGAEEGEIRADVPPEALANYLLGMLRTQARDPAAVDQSARTRRLLVDLFLRGAAAEPHAGRCDNNEVRAEDVVE